jgi:adenylyltransferase/sulfurtransferase
VPLVSGAAVGTEGQVTVLCGGASAAKAPCYRCLFRTPAPPAHCARCADAGVLGPVPGVIGTLQAVEALKILSGAGEPLRGRLLLYDSLSARPFLCTTLPPPDAGCPACGEAPDAALSATALAAFDYAAFVAGPPVEPPAQQPPAEPPLPRVTCAAYAAAAAAGEPHLLVDVRPKHLCVVCSAAAACDACSRLMRHRAPQVRGGDAARRARPAVCVGCGVCSGICGALSGALRRRRRRRARAARVPPLPARQHLAGTTRRRTARCSACLCRHCN